MSLVNDWGNSTNARTKPHIFWFYTTQCGLQILWGNRYGSSCIVLLKWTSSSCHHITLSSVLSPIKKMVKLSLLNAFTGYDAIRSNITHGYLVCYLHWRALEGHISVLSMGNEGVWELVTRAKTGQTRGIMSVANESLMKSVRQESSPAKCSHESPWWALARRWMAWNHNTAST